MKEKVLDVLIYLFDHCIEENIDYSSKQEALITELENAGFSIKDIKKAFAWLESICINKDKETSIKPETNLSTFRIFDKNEQLKLNLDCQNFLYSIEKYGVFDKFIRELIIDRTMALELPEITLEHFKWVTLMVIANCNTGHTIEWLEDIIFENDYDTLH